MYFTFQELWMFFEKLQGWVTRLFIGCKVLHLFLWHYFLKWYLLYPSALFESPVILYPQTIVLKVWKLSVSQMYIFFYFIIEIFCSQSSTESFILLSVRMSKQLKIYSTLKVWTHCLFEFAVWHVKSWEM